MDVKDIDCGKDMSNNNGEIRLDNRIVNYELIKGENIIKEIIG